MLLKAQLTLERGSKLPILGVKSQPSPYVIIQCENNQYVSPIAKFNQNPEWKFNCSIIASDVTSNVNFYVYNNNTNGIDELLAFRTLQFGQLLTKTNSQYKLRLVNSLNQIIQSYLYLIHFDANPKDEYLPLTNRSCIKVRLINQLQESMSLTCQYGDQSFNFVEKYTQNTLKFNPKQDSIQFTLRSKSALDSFTLKSQLLVRNINENSFFMLRFYHSTKDIYIYISAGLVLNGLVPQNFNTLWLKINDVTNNSGKNIANYQIKINGPLNECYLNEKKEAEIYIQNSSSLVIDYYEQGQIKDGKQPYCTFKVPINSINWKEQIVKQNINVRYYDTFKNIETTINFDTILKRNSEPSNVIPKLNPPQNLFDIDTTISFEQIKLSNCYLFEVIKDAAVQLIHIDMHGIIKTSKKFIIKDKKTQYLIDTKLLLKSGGKGTLYLICLDYGFSDNPSQNIEDSTIFKVPLEKVDSLQKQKIDFAFKFLSFAKKKSLVNVCKLFNQMVHDSLMTIKPKYRLSGQTKPGILKLVNLKSSGPYANLEIKIRIDGVEMTASGVVGNYLLQKGYSYKVSQGNVQLSINMQNLPEGALQYGPNTQNGTNSKNGFTYNWHGRFEDIFGTPTQNKFYMFQLKISQIHKLQLVYTYEESVKTNKAVIQQKDQLIFKNCNIHCQLLRAFVPSSNQTYKFKLSRSNYTYQTLNYPTNNQKIYFNSCQTAHLPIVKPEEQDFIFLSCYSYDSENNLTIYNGSVNARQIFGLGEYQVALTYQKQDKLLFIYLVFEITNMPPLQLPSVKLKLNNLAPNQSIQAFRSIFKYYLLIKSNQVVTDILQCTLQNQQLKINSAILIFNRDQIDLDLYTSYKSISKQLFFTTEKELIGRGQCFWQDIQLTGTITINFYPKKQSQLKLSKNSLILQQQSIKLFLNYTTQQSKIQIRKQQIIDKKSQLELDVLSSGMAKINLDQCVMFNIQGKIIQIQVTQLGLQISAQSQFSINNQFWMKANNMELALNATITTKDGSQYKKINSSATIKLRGNHYRINQPIPLKFIFDDYAMLTGHSTIYCNKFTYAPKGNIQISQVSFRGNVEVERFEVFFLSSIGLNENKQSIIKSQGPYAKNKAIALSTSDIANGFYFVIQTKGIKINQNISFAELSLDKYDQSQIFQKIWIVKGQTLILSINYKYSFIKQETKNNESIKYKVVGQCPLKQITIKYKNSELTILNNRQITKQFPKKSKGLLLKVTIPPSLSTKTKTVQIELIGKTNLIMPSSLVNPCEFVYYTNQLVNVKNIKLNNAQVIDKNVEPLGISNGISKFMIDQNPKLMCTLTSTQTSITSLNNQNWVFRFNLHRVITLSGKRLLHLKKTLNDQVLTKKLGLMVKHCQQYHMIFDLDQFGMPNQLAKDLQFGYNNSSNLLEIYLFVDNYFSRKQQNNFDRLYSNWVELMPISYGIINLSELPQEPIISCKIEPMVNNSLNLDHAISNLIVREEDTFVGGSISFSKKSWGYLQVKLVNNTGLTFNNKKQADKFYIHYKLQIQDSSRSVLKSTTTQARTITEKKDIKFTKNSINMLLIQSNPQQHYNIKIVGYLINSTNHYQLFQKRQDLSQYLQKKGNSQLNIQIKPNETNNVIQNIFQITIEITNSANLKEKIDLVQRAKEINKVDALSFREMSSIQFFQKIIGCEQLSHFYQCLQELKQSFIYKEDPQLQILVFLTQYLLLNFDPHLLQTICQIIQITFLKAPLTILELEKEGVILQIYQNFKIICSGQSKKIPKQVIKVSHQQYINAISNFKANKILTALKQVIQKQQYLLYPSEKLLQSATLQCNEIILNIMTLIVRSSKKFTQIFSKEIQQWIQIFGFVQSPTEFQLFISLMKTCLSNGLILQQNILHRWIDILVAKQYSLPLVFDFWQKVKQDELKVKLYQTILVKYQTKFQSEPSETNRGAKMMLQHILKFKKESISTITQTHQHLIKLLIENSNKSTDIVLVSSTLDFLSTLNDAKLLSQNQKALIIPLIKQKINSMKQNSSKLILTNFNTKFNKNKEVKMIKKDGKAIEPESKNGFYSKYLITKD